MLALVLAVLLQSSADTTQLRFDLQGVYDEIAQAGLQFDSPLDVDEFHAVFYTPDWSFVDASGTRHTWSELREQTVATALNEAKPDGVHHTLEKITPVSGGATVTVLLETSRTITDDAGRYGRRGAMHTLVDVTRYRDQWVMVEGSWRMRERNQLGATKTLVDRPQVSDLPPLN
jgi:hypothetical protein